MLKQLEDGRREVVAFGKRLNGGARKGRCSWGDVFEKLC